MAQKPCPWKKLTPAQMDLMERLAAAGGSLPYNKLEYRDLVAFEELRKLGFTDMRPKGRTKLEAALTEKGETLRAEGYRTEQIVVRVTGPQIDLLRHLTDSPIDDSVGQPLNALPGVMLDVCRRMSLRGWVEWYQGWDGSRWARLAPAGREVLEAIDALDEAITQMAEARRRGRLQ
ncbi:MAG: hypothetical protein JWM58_2327 [Rhizobium sp.]|nr:hypothetical protein [Rhizobium sp.]